MTEKRPRKPLIREEAKDQRDMKMPNNLMEPTPYSRGSSWRSADERIRHLWIINQEKHGLRDY